MAKKSNIFQNILLYLSIGMGILSQSGCATLNQTFSPERMVLKNKGLYAPANFNSEGEKLSSANKIVLEFPVEIPGAKDVRKYLISGADKCIIHIKQVHLHINPEMEDEKSLKRTEEIQESIYSIISYLNKSYKLGNVYREGVHKYNQSSRALNSSVYAVDALEESGEIEVKGAEKYSDYTWALFTLEKILKLSPISFENALNSHMKDIYDDREDATLEILSEEESDPASLVVFGAVHAWGGIESCGLRYFNNRKAYSSVDNIYKWNKKHPENKFSLIEITPIGY